MHPLEPFQSSIISFFMRSYIKGMINPEKIIYPFNIEDIQNVAEQELERKLMARELRGIV